MSPRMFGAAAPVCQVPCLRESQVHIVRKKSPRPASLRTYARVPRTNAVVAVERINADAKIVRHRFPNLRASDFRHPLDEQNTRILKTIPGVDLVSKEFMAPIIEQMLYIENIGTSVLVGEKQVAGLHKSMLEAADILGIAAPDVYVRQSAEPNAYTLAISGKKPFVVVTTSLIELLSPEELQVVLAHELGHLKCDHGVWLTFANLLAVSAFQIPGIGALIYSNVQDALMRWVRAAELTCDRAALLVAQDPKVVVSVMMKLAGGCPTLAKELNVEAFLEQARSYDEATNNPIGWYLRNAQSSQLTHPLPVLRAREIDRWAASEEFTALLKRGRRQAGSSS